tara:strand:- start:329 stop:913 length:585 start_codon:yes stop_codon:yes gene_type:complete
MAREFSRLEKALAALVGLDIARPGTNRAAAKAAVGALARGGRVLVPAAARTTTSLAAANPALTGALLGGAALQTPQGQQLLDIAEERGRTDRLAVDRTVQDLLYGTAEKVKRGTKKRKTKFNQAVSSGLKALKASTSYGAKGKISNAKAAFKTATKAASSRLQGKKAPKKGPARTAYMAAKKVYTDEILRRKMK